MLREAGGRTGGRARYYAITDVHGPAAPTGLLVFFFKLEYNHKIHSLFTATAAPAPAPPMFCGKLNFIPNVKNAVCPRMVGKLLAKYCFFAVLLLAVLGLLVLSPRFLFADPSAAMALPSSSLTNCTGIMVSGASNS